MDGTFKSVPYIIQNELTEKQKENLLRDLWSLINERNIYTVATLLMTTQTTEGRAIITEIKEILWKFIFDNFGYSKVENAY